MLNHSNVNRIVLLSAAGVFIAALMFLLAYGLSNRSSPTGRSGQQLIGSIAPIVDGELIDGNTFSYPEVDSPVMVINFWASWCPPCRRETPSFEKLWRGYKEENVVFLGINVQDSKEDALRYIDEFDVTFPNLLDSDGTITVDYGVTGLPVTFFVASDRKIISRWVGSISEERLDNKIKELIGSSNQSENVLDVDDGYFRALK